MSDNTTQSFFKVSPLNALMKVLLNLKTTDHFLITNTKREVAGSATLQKFPKFQILGKPAIPILLHSHVYPLGKGGQFAGFTSSIYWFNFETGALMASCNYSDNKTATFSKGMGPWDWVVSDGPELELPKQQVMMNFASNDTYYSSAWAECNTVMGSMENGIGHGNGYIFGERYSLSDTKITRKVTIDSVSMPGIVKYNYTTKTETLNEETTDTISFWVNAAQEQIQYVTCTLPVITIDSNRNHSWAYKDTRWVRLELT